MYVWHYKHNTRFLKQHLILLPLSNANRTLSSVLPGFACHQEETRWHLYIHIAISLANYYLLLLFSFSFSSNRTDFYFQCESAQPSSCNPHYFVAKPKSNTNFPTLLACSIRIQYSRVTSLVVISPLWSVCRSPFPFPDLLVFEMMVPNSVKIVVSLAWGYVAFSIIAPAILREAYEIRLEAIREYGKQICGKVV